MFADDCDPVAALELQHVVLVRIRRKDTRTVVRALVQRIQRFPRGLIKSLTWDRGTELANHRHFTVATKVHARTCRTTAQVQLDAIAHRLNIRPRLTLGFQTPAAKLAEIVASTG